MQASWFIPEYCRHFATNDKIMKTALLWLRTLFFYLGFALIIVIFGLVSCVSGILHLPTRLHQNLVTTGNFLIMKWLRVCCGIKIRLVGAEYLPDSPAVILSNHESTWETFYLQRLFRPVSTTLKRELLRIPFFGWGLYFMHPIPIDRGNPKAALKQVNSVGQQRLKEGNNVLIFPEGTRHAREEKKTYARSGAAIAINAGVSIIPVAHNAANCWPGDTYLKRPGIITVMIGNPIDTRESDSRSLTQQVQEWIETQREALE